MQTMKQERRKGVLARLEAQLASGVKTEKVSQLTLATTGANTVPLEDADIKRIKSEIAALKDYLSGKKKASKVVGKPGEVQKIHTP